MYLSACALCLTDRRVLFKVKCHSWSKQSAAVLWCNCDMCHILFIIIMSAWRSINPVLKVNSSKSNFTLMFRGAVHCKSWEKRKEREKKKKETYWPEQRIDKHYHQYKSPQSTVSHVWARKPKICVFLNSCKVSKNSAIQFRNFC